MSDFSKDDAPGDDTRREPDDHKVIDLFHRPHHPGAFPSELRAHGECAVSPDGFPYVTVKQDADSPHGEEELLSLAHHKHYLIRMLEHHRDAIRVNHYHVPGDRLAEFLTDLDKRPGLLLEIQPFFPETTA